MAYPAAPGPGSTDSPGGYEDATSTSPKLCHFALVLRPTLSLKVDLQGTLLFLTFARARPHSQVLQAPLTAETQLRCTLCLTRCSVTGFSKASHIGKGMILSSMPLRILVSPGIPWDVSWNIWSGALRPLKFRSPSTGALTGGMRLSLISGLCLAKLKWLMSLLEVTFSGRSVDPFHVIAKLRAGRIHCTLNEIPIAADAAFHEGAESVVCTEVVQTQPSGPSNSETAAGSPAVWKPPLFSSNTAAGSDRPPTPPVPESSSGSDRDHEPVPPVTPAEDLPMPPSVARRWGKAHRAAQVIEARLAIGDLEARCTSFDPTLHFRFVQSPACVDANGFRRYTLERATHLGEAREGRVLQYSLAGFPEPQICVHPVIASAFVALPVGLSAGVACTVCIEREASAFQLMLLLEKACQVDRLHRHLVAKQLSHVIVNDEVVRDPFASGAFRHADSASILGAYVALAHATVQEIAPLHVHHSRRDGFLTVHRPLHAPVQVFVSPPLDLPRELRRLGLLSSAGLIFRPATLAAMRISLP